MRTAIQRSQPVNRWLCGVLNMPGAKRRFGMSRQGVWQRCVETARLMVGIGDYERYRSHMRHCHPDQQPMSEVEYFRRCQESRYPGKDGSIKRCPC